MSNYNGSSSSMKLLLLTILYFISIYPINVIGHDSTNPATLLEKELRFVVPVRELDNDYIKVVELSNGEKNFTGFTIDVFNAAAGYAIPSVRYRFIPFAKPDGTMNGTMDDMLNAVSHEEYDGAVSEAMILYYRMQKVDFTMPYLATGISMLVATKDRNKTPLTPATVVLVVLVGLLGVCILLAVLFWIRNLCEYNRMPYSTRPAGPIMGSIMYTRLAIILLLMVLLLTIASFTPRRTSASVAQSPVFTDIQSLDDLKRKGSKVGYGAGGFVKNLLVSKGGLLESQLVAMDSEVEMLDKLKKGSQQGGVDAIVGGSHYIKPFQKKHCDANIALVNGFNLKTEGLGFAFPRGQSPSLVDRFSEAIVKLIDSGEMKAIQERTVGNFNNICPEKTTIRPSEMQDILAIWLPVGSGIFIVVLVILLLYFYLNA